MKRDLVCFMSVLLLITLSFSAMADNLRWVDPMIGTDGIGHTFPAATVPFGMVQVGPTNDFKDWNWCGGYHYSDKVIKGFAHDFLSGGGIAAGGDILLMPTTLSNPSEALVGRSYHCMFSHDNEHASAGYYSVLLDDYDIFVELTANERMAVHRYTFNKGGRSNVLIDPRHELTEQIQSVSVEHVDNRTMLARKTCFGGASGYRTVYAYIEFSKPFSSYEEGEYGYVVYDQLNKGERIEVKICISFVDYEGAERNFHAQDSTLDFQAVRRYAEEQWRTVLDRINVVSKDEAYLRSFYTAMYHSFISPNLISDVDGRYYVEGKVYEGDIAQYSNYSTWDTFRVLHPLFTLIEHEKNAEFISSLTSRYSDCGLPLPLWECLGHDYYCMIGNSTFPVICEAIVKGIPGFDVEKAYEAMYASVNEQQRAGSYGESGMNDYVIRGYVPAEIRCSVTKTCEYNYFDWCLSRAADALGKNEDCLFFAERSLGHMRLYDAETGYLLPKERYGTLVGKDRLQDWDWLQNNYVSGNLWGYSVYAPHNMNALIGLHGGPAAFEKWLDNVFEGKLEVTGTQHVDISGFIGTYGHGDEPSHHMAYLYALCGAPHKTRHYIREIMKRFYSDRPDGLVNNDDLGQLSSWYIFSSLGFYPVDPCSKKYILGLPAAERMEVNLANGKRFVVRSENFSADKEKVKAIWLNGNQVLKPYITHEEIMNGGELLFEFAE